MFECRHIADGICFLKLFLFEALFLRLLFSLENAVLAKNVFENAAFAIIEFLFVFDCIFAHVRTGD